MAEGRTRCESGGAKRSRPRGHQCFSEKDKKHIPIIIQITQALVESEADSYFYDVTLEEKVTEKSHQEVATAGEQMLI
jgi:hypothetical protein